MNMAAMAYLGLMLLGLVIVIVLLRERYRGQQIQPPSIRKATPPPATAPAQTSAPPAEPAQAEAANSQPQYELVTNETAKGRGYVVRRLRDQKLLSWQYLPKEDGIQCLAVVGVSFHHKDLQQPGFAAGFPIQLVQEPDNPVDPDAVAVRDFSGRYQAGHLSRDDAPKILKRVKKGIGFQAMVMWEINIDGERVCLRVLLLDRGTTLKLTVPEEALSAWEKTTS